MSDTCKTEKFLGFLKTLKRKIGMRKKKGGGYEVWLCCRNGDWTDCL
jgi:hypothetical protein